MLSRELYCKGARVWIADAVNVWQGAEVTEDFKANHLKLHQEDGNALQLVIKKDSDLPPLRNPDILIGENDLTSLSYLHEPAVLYNLQYRFINHNAIYTYCGIVLVAINPYEDLPIYGNDTIFAYRGQAMGDLDPHIFAVAEAAYTKMEKDEENQSIIVSGESGAGKTVSAKYAMRYFATVGGSSTETQIEKKVLASSPIMEAIGNAKTTRNDNSSRFGKYIEIDFSKNFNIVGASMRTYLLEKSRVVFQAQQERNYHIFYQLCASRKHEDLHDLQLESQNVFHYTNQGESPMIPGVDDTYGFDETRGALTLLGFNQQEQKNLFRILAAILHLGNVAIDEAGSGDQESSTISAKDKHLVMMAQLLEISKDEMRMWLCHRKIVSMREFFNKPMTASEASFARDALAKHIYARLFDWIVWMVNKSLATSEKGHKFIGVLDIYGFETFEINSFEQFCINYANEKLQQQFNQHVFKLEQEEYVREQIEWKFIDFYDNQPCIDLIESKLGILDLLDEECKMPRGTDQSWVDKLFDKCKKSEHFSKPRLSNSAFIIHHFADNVEYESVGFLEKNRDTVIEEQINILKASQNNLVMDLFAEGGFGALRVPKPQPRTKVRVAATTKQPQPTGSSKQHKKSVGSQFRESLSLLMSTLNSTTPHYVRCIKPNDDKKSFVFDPKRAVQQLRACGVLETIRISAAGYPSRWTYEDFFLRYRVLCRSKDIRRDNMRATSETILVNVIKKEDQYQFGKTKIFIRAGQVAYLEKLRFDKLRACGIMITKHIRGWLVCTRYRRLRKATIHFQSRARGFLARRQAQHLRETKAAICIQRYVRGFVKRKQYLQLRLCTLHLQARIRGMWARQRYNEMVRNSKAIVIQKHIRGFLERRRYQRTMRHIVIAQSAVRRWLARRELKRLKVEARSVEHVKKLNKGLENKIISLQQKIDEMNKENSSLKAMQNEYNLLRSKLDNLKHTEAELKMSSGKVKVLEEEIQALKEQLGKEMDEKVDLVNEKVRLEEELCASENMLKEKISQLTSDLEEKHKAIQLHEKESEEMFKKRIEQEKCLLVAEHDQERIAYQKLLKDYHRMEQKKDNLEGEVARLRSSHHRTASDVSTVSANSEVSREGEDSRVATSDVPEEDGGYGSVRSNLSVMSSDNRGRLEGIDWSQGSGELVHSQFDVGLVLKLQQKLTEAERERARLEKRLEERDESPLDDPRRAQESIRLQELEVENDKIKADLWKLRKSVAESDASTNSKELYDQFVVAKEELERRREECIQLRTVLANQTQDLKEVAKSYTAKDVDIINEDGELIMAFETQKKIIRQLEKELQVEKAKSKELESDYRTELEKLKEDNERQQKLLSQNLNPQSKTEAFMQHEIARLTGENLDLREKLDNLMEQLRKCKRQLKIYAKKVKEAGGLDAVADVADITKDRDLMAVVRKKEREYMGMFVYRKEEEVHLIRSLIYELKPKVAVTLLPGLPAYILFMSIRHTDYVNDDEKVRSLLSNTINAVKRVIKKRHEDLETTIMWLANTLRLLHNLKQYSGDKAFQADNTAKQNEQCLLNFDLSEYRQVLSDIAVWIYQAVIKLMEEKVQPLIVPAVLEHEAISGLSGQRPGGRGRASSVTQEVSVPVDARRALDLLQYELTTFNKMLGVHGVDPELITQVFRQIFYFICAGALNNLLLRKDLCHWSKGMQIRYNLSHLEQWCRDHKLQEGGVLEILQPVIQAAQLLQARKTDEDVQSICDMCDKLSVFQIIKILNLYTPADEFEERVPISFIRKIQQQLHEREVTESQGHEPSILLDTKFAFPVRFPFNPSNIRLEDIEIPDVLNLPMLKKL